jgi:hypothetical protein
VAHAYNSSYSGGRDQEDHNSKPAQANSSTRPYLEKLFTKIGLAQGEGPEFQTLVPQKKRKENLHMETYRE